MAQHKSAEKRIRQDKKRYERNKTKRSQMRTAIKKIRNAPDKDTATAELKNTFSILDRLAVQGVIHKNKAANLKAKLSKHIASME
jgi:small subunit ribosomal protein S20